MVDSSSTTGVDEMVSGKLSVITPEREAEALITTLEAGGVLLNLYSNCGEERICSTVLLVDDDFRSVPNLDRTMALQRETEPDLRRLRPHVVALLRQLATSGFSG